MKIEIGAEVAVRSGMDDSHITFRTIARLTDTLIILDDETRYQRGAQHYQVGLGRHANRRQLKDPQDPDIRNAVARTQYREIGNAAHAVMHGAGATLHRMNADVVLGELAKLEAMIEAARADIERRAGR
jgi:hypothetical protein